MPRSVPSQVCRGGTRQRRAVTFSAMSPASPLADATALDVSARKSRRARPGVPDRCEWCGRELPGQDGVGRRRRYCAQACRQRAYENRHALERGQLPPDAVVISTDERDSLADRLFQVRCAAEDVATAIEEGASRAELSALATELLEAARQAEHIR